MSWLAPGCKCSSEQLASCRCNEGNCLRRADLLPTPAYIPNLQEHAADAGDASQVKGDTLTDRDVLEGTSDGPSLST